MSRLTCYRCFWPQTLCWCSSITPMETRTRFVFLMHPKEYKQVKAATGRLTHLCLANSVIHVGIGFDQNEEVQAILRDPGNYPVLLYPGPTARNISREPFPPGELEGRRLVVFLLDGTWALGRKMLRLSPTLQPLPRIMFLPTAPSRYQIKQQPHPSCLSTLEATHEVLVALAQGGLDQYPLPAQLLGLFDRMQNFQLQCAADPARTGYRHRTYRPASERQPPQGRSGARRRRMFNFPPVKTNGAPG